MGQTPARFGPYELVRRLGVGGMAETFLAVRRGPGGFEQRVCLKRTLPAFESDREFVRLFIDEARVSALLRHANIAQVLDFGEVDGSHYLALELVEGMDLRELCARLGARGETMTSGLVVYLAMELGAALAFAHKARHGDGVTAVVHRDISPSNVLVSSEGEVKLTDFGIAKAIRGDHVTKSGAIKGKVPYMAPEYALSAKFDQRADLFALGITLYETLAGRRPFDGVTDLDTLHRICNGTHTPLGELVPNAPRALVDAIEQLIRPDPADRFQSARAMLDALVDVAPPPTARRILGELVEGLTSASRERDPAQPGARASGKIGTPTAFEDTLSATPQGTVMLPDAAVPARRAREVVVAGPGDRTRTRAAEGLLVPEGSTRTVHDASPGTVPETRASDPALTSPGQARRRSEPGAAVDIAAAQTRPLDEPPRARVPSTFDPPLENPVVARARRRTTVLLAVLGIAVAVTGGLLGWSAWHAPAATERGITDADARPTPAPAAPPTSSPAPVAPTPASPPTPSPAAPPAPSAAPVAPTPALAVPSTLPAGASTPAPAQPAVLQITVIPFGKIWLDGRLLGNSPQRAIVRPGRHSVSTGETAPSQTQTVRVSAGEHRSVTIR